jgi:hypothetical protein
MQVRGGRGYETAASLASRGEAAVPLEQLLRDLRINRIFEGTNQVMRLFIAREALDLHLAVAGEAVMPGVPLGRRLSAFVRAGLFYAVWYPSRWIGWSEWPRYREFGRLAGHLRWADRTARRLARQQFHLMVAHGAALEKKQAQLFRCVDIGAELYAMAAICVRAHRDARRGGEFANAEELADLFCRQARAKIESLFGSIVANADPEAYRVARAALDERYAWLERGIIEAPNEASRPAETSSGAAVGS